MAPFVVIGRDFGARITEDESSVADLVDLVAFGGCEGVGNGSSVATCHCTAEIIDEPLAVVNPKS